MAVNLMGPITKERIRKRLCEAEYSLLSQDFSEPDWIIDTAIINTMLTKFYFDKGEEPPGDIKRSIWVVNSLANKFDSPYRIQMGR